MWMSWDDAKIDHLSLVPCPCVATGKWFVCVLLWGLSLWVHQCSTCVKPPVSFQLEKEHKCFGQIQMPYFYSAPISRSFLGSVCVLSIFLHVILVFFFSMRLIFCLFRYVLECYPLSNACVVLCRLLWVTIVYKQLLYLFSKKCVNTVLNTHFCRCKGIVDGCVQGSQRQGNWSFSKLYFGTFRKLFNFFHFNIYLKLIS